MPKIVIIGSSIAGHSVASELRNRNKEVNITLLTQEPYPLYDRRRLPEYLAKNLKERELFLIAPEFYEEKNIDFLRERDVVSVATVRKQVTVRYKDERETYEYDFLVVCSGCRTIFPEIEGINKDGVYKLDSLADYKQLRGHLISDPVCLIGDFSPAVPIALAVSAKGREVKIIAQDVDPAIALPQAVQCLPTQVVELIGESGIQAVRIKEGKIIGTSLPVFIGSKKKPNIDFLKGDVDLVDGYLGVNERMQTSAPTIFACGAVCLRKDGQTSGKNWDSVIAESNSLVESLIPLIGV